jgi:uncharacterized damage-inducible protein DinB
VRKYSPILFLFFSFCGLNAQPITDEERNFVIGLLETSASNFLTSIASVSEQQWSFKPSSANWSIREIAEHITLAEELLFSITQKTLSAPADVEKAKSLDGRDDLILKKIADRTIKAQAPEMINPTGKFLTTTDLTGAFISVREKTIAYLRSTDAPLKDHVAMHPFIGEMTVYQWFVFIAGHTNRHVEQLKEVKANTKYPKI